MSWTTKLYEKAAAFHSISVEELQERLVNGEALIHKYYVGIYGKDFI